MLPSGQPGADDNILHELHTETIPKKDERDPIGEIHRRFGTTLTNMNRSPLDPGIRPSNSDPTTVLLAWVSN